VLPPGKRNTKRNLKTSINVSKSNKPEWTPCGSSRERDITLFEEKTRYVRKRMNLGNNRDASALLL